MPLSAQQKAVMRMCQRQGLPQREIAKQLGISQKAVSRLLRNAKHRIEKHAKQTCPVHAYPIHVVSEWIGNTPEVAMDHYLQVVDADFKTAARSAAQNPAHSR